MDNVTHLSKKLKTMNIDDKPHHQKNNQNTKPVDKSDDDDYIMTCRGVDNNSNVYVVLRVKRKR